MRQVEISLPKPHPTQAEALDKCKRFNLWCCGRRWGKDVIQQRRKAIMMVKSPAPYAWFAPSYRMMTENYREMVNRLSPLIKRASASENVIELVNGSVLDFWSLDSEHYNTARGRKYQHITINEAAQSPKLLDAWNFVLRPTLADLEGGADFGTTPKGINGFHVLWTAAQDHPDWSRLHYTTWDNPTIPRKEIEAMRDTLPARVYKQEIMAEFLEDGSFFQGVEEAAVIQSPDRPEQHEGHRIYAGLDWALSEDFTVLTFICQQCNRVVDWWRANKMDFTYQREAIIDRCRRWKAIVLPERNSIGEPNIELLIAAGINVAYGMDGKPGFNTTSTTKAQLIQRVASGLEHDKLKIPIEFADEFRAYEVEMSMSGHAKYSAPEGRHDDRVISTALAWWGVGIPYGAALVDFG